MVVNVPFTENGRKVNMKMKCICVCVCLVCCDCAAHSRLADAIFHARKRKKRNELYKMALKERALWQKSINFHSAATTTRMHCSTHGTGCRMNETADSTEQ